MKKQTFQIEEQYMDNALKCTFTRAGPRAIGVSCYVSKAGMDQSKYILKGGQKHEEI